MLLDGEELATCDDPAEVERDDAGVVSSVMLSGERVGVLAPDVLGLLLTVATPDALFVAAVALEIFLSGE